MGDFKSRLLANQQYLAENLKLDDVLPKLYADDTINKQEYDSLKNTVACRGMAKAADELVVLLTKKDTTAFSSFLSSLRNTGQSGQTQRLIESALLVPHKRIMAQVTVIPAKDQNPAAYVDVCRETIKILNDTTADVRKKITMDYDLGSLLAKPTHKQPLRFSLEMKSKSIKGAKKIHDDIKNQHLALLIKQHSHISDVRRPYNLLIKIGEQEISDRRGNPIAVYRSIVHHMIDSKDYTSYDLWMSLHKHKGTYYKSPVDLSDEEGVPLTHMCVDRGRLDLLSVFLHMGWWTMLSRKKGSAVPSTSNSLYKGMTCQEVAEDKDARKAVEEVKMYTEWEESLSSIMKSARAGDATGVAELIARGGEAIHKRDINNGNALYWAVVSGKMEIFQDLLRKGGLDPTMRTRKNETLLHIACLLGRTEFIPTLIKCNIAVTFEDTNKRSALDRVAENGDVDALKEFLSCDITPNTAFPAIAACWDRLKLLQYCLDKCHTVDSLDQYSRTPIMRAVERNRIDVIQYLINRGARLDTMPTTNKNLLHIVAEAGSSAVFNMLLPELKKHGLFETFLNAKDRYSGTELCFLIRGRDKGRGAWHYVEVSRHRVSLFLKKTKSGNVDVAAFGTVLKSGWGMDPDQETIDYIEEMYKKRRLDLTAPADSTSLHIAIFKGNTDVAKLLLQHGADVHIKDKFGLTPLMLAAAKNNMDMVLELDKYGARFDDVNVDGQNVANIAYESENEDIINYIGNRDYYRRCENFLKEDVARLKSKLSQRKLDELRSQGENVKTHIISTLKGCTMAINQMLQDMVFGPILDASEDTMVTN